MQQVHVGGAATSKNGKTVFVKRSRQMPLSFLINRLLARFESERGQTMAEYGVILAVITVGIVAALTALSGGIQGAIGGVVKSL
jgi:Flp pilus assembly pilin Flp